MDIWVLGDPDLSTHEHLLRLVSDILDSAVPDKPWVYSNSPHHYTEGGIEVNVLNDGATGRGAGVRSYCEVFAGAPED